jgi:hypothetical protein
MVLALVVSPPAVAQLTDVKADVRDVLEKLEDPELLERTYGALGATHLARRQWGFALLSDTELRPWQRALAPGMPALVELLGEEGGMEWVDQNGVTEKTTTPRKEAALALLALERASIEPLIAVLDRPRLARKADEVLRQIVRGGPPGHDRASWQAWWAQHRNEPLHNEKGQGWLVLLLALAAAAVVGLILWRSRGGPTEIPMADRLRAPPPAT